MSLSVRIFQGLFTALAWVVWQFIFEPLYKAEMLARGGVYGVGEAFLGATMVVFVTIIISEILIRRLRRAEAD